MATSLPSIAKAEGIFTELVGIQMLLMNALEPLLCGDQLTREQVSVQFRQSRQPMPKRRTICSRSAVTGRRNEPCRRSTVRRKQLLNSVILGFRGRSQMEARWRGNALSAATKLTLRCRTKFRDTCSGGRGGRYPRRLVGDLIRRPVASSLTWKKCTPRHPWSVFRKKAQGAKKQHPACIYVVMLGPQVILL
jgi:hypothetical protein